MTTVTEKPSVLIVEDHSEVAETIGLSLAAMDVDVYYAADGILGLAIAMAKKPDLIVLDLMLPKLSGLMFLELLRKNSDLDCPIVILTGNAGTRHRDYAHLLGAHEYFTKPFKPSQLAQRISELMELKISESVAAA